MKINKNLKAIRNVHDMRQKIKITLSTCCVFKPFFYGKIIFKKNLLAVRKLEGRDDDDDNVSRSYE